MKNLLLKKVEKSCIIIFSLFIGSFGYAQIALRSTSSATSTSTNLTINKPAGLVVNDLMIVNLAQGNNDINVPTSPGWTLIDGRSLARRGRRDSPRQRACGKARPGHARGLRQLQRPDHHRG